VNLDPKGSAPSAPNEGTDDDMATSQNGWTAASSTAGIPGGVTSIIPKGAPDTKLTVRKGDVATVLQYVVDEYQATVEDIDLYTKGTGDDWGFAPRPVRGSSTTLSNHASATAIDLNATRHPLAVKASSTFTAKQLTAMRAIKSRLRNAVQCGAFYSGRPDGMHWEINVGSSTLAKVADDIRSGKIKRTGEAVKPATSTPKPLDHKPLISLKAVQAGIKSGTELVEGLDGSQYQEMLNRYTGFKLVTDGVLGRNTRVVTAQAQLKVAKANGNKTLTIADCWPNSGYNSDLDGIPGAELFKALGVDNSDS